MSSPPLPAEIVPVAKRFYADYVGITDPNELCNHLNKIRARLCEEGPIYRCIDQFKFAYSRMCQRFFYEKILRIGKRQPSPWLFDIGCCTGIDLRQLMLDGYPAEYLVGTDISRHYIDCGYDLCRDDQESLPIQFVVSNVFDSTFVDTMSAYHHQTAVVYAGSLIHLFHSSDLLRQFLQRVKWLLRPGGLLVGAHVASDHNVCVRRGSRGYKQYIGLIELQHVLESEGFTDFEMQMDERLLQDDEPKDLIAFWLSFCAVYRL
ncbi:hypothetical protein DFQ28_011447 [Apophysomyces sp. BC1034]|nr:hypothetical protein DFQ30_011066 [Apophysomyces sp. BC1015]KAG0181150.1 hypothetical protein DFQ29_009186 [Apophysomyces sp. BC1021]KAG0191608.1 hypothetical protein DFQ28_011447 [Apophysomyces sp. BC1034]